MCGRASPGSKLSLIFVGKSVALGQPEWEEGQASWIQRKDRKSGPFLLVPHEPGCGFQVFIILTLTFIG